MASYIIRRLLASIPALLLVSIIIFGILRIVPGDVISANLENLGYVTPEDLERMKAENAALRAEVEGNRGGELVSADLVLALGLFGIGVLEAGPLAELHAALKPRAESGGGGGCGGDEGGCGGGCGGCGGCG